MSTVFEEKWKTIEKYIMAPMIRINVIFILFVW